MKTNKIITALILGLAVVACTNNSATKNGSANTGEKTAKDYVPTAAQRDSISYLLGVNFGSFIKGYNFGDVNYSQVIKGMKAYINAKGSPRDSSFAKQFKIDPNKMNEMFSAYIEMQRNHQLLINKDKEQKFLEENKTKPGVSVTPSGLQYTITEKGNANVPGPQDTVWVRYKGTFTDGTVFDETKQGAEPVSFTLGQVIPGWSEGLQLIGEGGKEKLYIPSALGYGEQGNSAIEPDATLIFDVELVKVRKFVEPAPQPAAAVRKTVKK